MRGEQKVAPPRRGCLASMRVYLYWSRGLHCLCIARPMMAASSLPHRCGTHVARSAAAEARCARRPAAARGSRGGAARLRWRAARRQCVAARRGGHRTRRGHALC
eukprot:6177223-Pleurochrysis_carterae.AAC.2